MIKVEIYQTPHGSYVAHPVSTRVADKFAAHMQEMGAGDTAEVFFQGDYELPESVTSNRKVMYELNNGYPVRLLVDPWEYGHWLGWDAHNVEV